MYILFFYPAFGEADMQNHTIGKDTIRRGNTGIAFPDYADEFNCEFDDLPLIIRDGHEYGHQCDGDDQVGPGSFMVCGARFSCRAGAMRPSKSAPKLAVWAGTTLLTQKIYKPDEGDPAHTILIASRTITATTPPAIMEKLRLRVGRMSIHLQRFHRLPASGPLVTPAPSRSWHA